MAVIFPAPGFSFLVSSQECPWLNQLPGPTSTHEQVGRDLKVTVTRASPPWDGRRSGLRGLPGTCRGAVLHCWDKTLDTHSVKEESGDSAHGLGDPVGGTLALGQEQRAAGAAHGPQGPSTQPRPQLGTFRLNLWSEDCDGRLPASVIRRLMVQLRPRLGTGGGGGGWFPGPPGTASGTVPRGSDPCPVLPTPGRWSPTCSWAPGPWVRSRVTVKEQPALRVPTAVRLNN